MIYFDKEKINDGINLICHVINTKLPVDCEASEILMKAIEMIMDGAGIEDDKE